MRAEAHETNTSIIRVDDEIGQYHFVIITTPTASSKEFWLKLILTNNWDGTDSPQPILDADVQVTFELSGTASSAFSFGLPPEPKFEEFGYYEKLVTVPSAGYWNIKLDVQGSLGTESATFPLFFDPALDWMDLLKLALAIVSVLLLFLFYQMRSHGRRNSAKTTPQMNGELSGFGASNEPAGPQQS
jgi:hypothetical protein